MKRWNKKISCYLIFEGIKGLALSDGYWKIIPYKVAAAFLKHLLPYVTPRVVGTAKNAPDSDRRDFVGWQVPLSTEGQSLEVP